MHSVTWVDRDGNLWLFGGAIRKFIGNYFPIKGNEVYSNDQPSSSNQLPQTIRQAVGTASIQSMIMPPMMFGASMSRIIAGLGWEARKSSIIMVFTAALQVSDLISS